MFFFPEPGPKDYRLRDVSINSLSSEQHTPFGFPRCTQTNLGLFSYPLPNTSSEYDVRKVNDIVLDRWTKESKAWWIGKPGEDAQMMFDMHQKNKDKAETDPRYMLRSSIFPRPYQYELDCMESRRQQKLIAKIQREELEKHRPKEPCICLEEESSKESSEFRDEVDKSRWHPIPDVFGKSQADPCKRREEFQKFGQSYKTEACRFYYDNYPPPPLSKRLQRFAK